MSKHVGENCGKLCISYILSSQRGITPSKIDAKLNMSKHVGEKCGKRADGDPDGRTETGRRVGRTDGDPDGHHHTIIRPV